MRLRPVPPVSAWTHSGVRAGFEVLFAGPTADGHVLRGHTTAVEGPEAWSVGYRIEVDRHWRTRRAEIEATTAAGTRRTVLERVDEGGLGAEGSHADADAARWLVDGTPDRRLDGCTDVDLESSAVTNTLPVHRLDLLAGAVHAVPAAFVQAGDLSVRRIEQEYRLLDRSESDQTADLLRFEYTSATFGFACELTYDASGLVLDYPGIAVRER